MNDINLHIRDRCFNQAGEVLPLESQYLIKQSSVQTNLKKFAAVRIKRHPFAKDLKQARNMTVEH